MEQTVQIKRVAQDGQTIDSFQLKLMAIVRAFLKRRGLLENQRYEITGITIRILRFELLQEVKRMREEKNVQACIELQRVHDDLDVFIKTVQKEERLFLVHPRPITF